MKKIIVSSLIVLGMSTAAFAQDAGPDFATVDADASGGATLVEVQAALPDMTQEQFTAADADANGELSADEFAAISAAPAP